MIKTSLLNKNHPLGKATLATVLITALMSPGVQAQPAPPVSPAPVVNYEYDAQGNPTKTIQAPGVAGFNFATTNSYDKLSRRKDSTDAKLKTTQFEYNGREDLTKVTDPRLLQTTYPRNGLGDATSLTSPDTGTATHTYDAAGNLKTRLDSRGVTATYSYDALNRPTSVVYSKAGETSLTTRWTYDEQGSGFSNGVGRLTSTAFPAAITGFVTDLSNVRLSTTYASGTTRYAYDPQGRLISSTQTVGAGSVSPPTLTVSYTYDAAGHITGITYPSGRWLGITYTGGLPSALTLAPKATSTPQTLLSQIQFDPFDGPKSWQWQMSSGPQSYERIRDSSGRLVRYRLGTTLRDLSYDAADRITAYTHYAAATGAATPALDQSFGYDELGRLSSVTVGSNSWALSYDDNGNRTSVTLNGNASSYTTASSSNRLMAVSNPARSLSYDSAGNTLTDTGPSTGFTAVYDLSNRLSQMTRAGTSANTSFLYDAMGQRVAKTPALGYTCNPSVLLSTGQDVYQCAVSTVSAGVLFVYDQQGQLLGEFDSVSGAPLREYVWLGNTLVAMFTNGVSRTPYVYYIHTDHLNTPRVVVDQSNNLRWRWLAEPFGTTAPETNPLGLGAFTQNLRAPGQYADAETGLAYNYFRDYDASSGRYAQSDPIGLAGGINTYSYALNQPTRYTDPTGQFVPLAVYAFVQTAPAWAPYLAYGTAALATAAATYLTLSPPSADGDYSPWSPDPDRNSEFVRDRDATKALEGAGGPPRRKNPLKPTCDELRDEIKYYDTVIAGRTGMTNKWYGGQMNPGHKKYVDGLQKDRDRLQRRLDRQDCTPC